ncbi:MAG: D-alanyl-D-alanine carboxypeptidase family protein [Gammaproteobacteria bacterium]
MRSRGRTAVSGLSLTLALFASSAMATEMVPKPPQVAAKAHILVDADSGQVLSEQNADTALEPASLTKIMTVYAVAAGLQQNDIHLADEVVVSEEAWKATGSRTFVEVAKPVKVQDLLLGVIVQSGNDASIALAEHLSGSEDVFAELMNLYAARLGLKGSHFMNSSGLPHPDHYMTARDAATVTVALIRDFPEIYKSFSIKEYTYNGIPQHNRNRLLWLDPAIDGVKTGHTQDAGYCLVASTHRKGMRLISVILGAQSESGRTQQSQSLLNYGFRFYETRRLFSALQPVAKARVWKGENPEVALGLERDLFVTIPRRQTEALKASVDLPQRITAPLNKGEHKGMLKVALGESVLLNRPLIALQAVAEGGIIQRLTDELKLLLKQVN